MTDPHIKKSPFSLNLTYIPGNQFGKNPKLIDTTISSFRDNCYGMFGYIRENVHGILKSYKFIAKETNVNYSNTKSTTNLLFFYYLYPYDPSNKTGLWFQRLSRDCEDHVRVIIKEAALNYKQDPVLAANCQQEVRHGLSLSRQGLGMNRLSVAC